LVVFVEPSVVVLALFGLSRTTNRAEQRIPFCPTKPTLSNQDASLETTPSMFFSRNMVMKRIMWARMVGLFGVLLILTFGFMMATATATEGLENYQPYSGSDPLILAQQNAGNIEYLKSRLDDAMNLKKNPEFAAVSSAVDTLTQQVAVLYQQQQSIASSAEVTGLTGLGSSDV